MTRSLSHQIPIGEMIERVAFRRPTFIKDEFQSLQRAIDDTPLTYRRARVTELSGLEAPNASPQDKAIHRIRVEMRSRGASDPVHSDELVWRGDTYDITDIRHTGRQRFIIIEARYIHTGA